MNIHGGQSSLLLSLPVGQGKCDLCPRNQFQDLARATVSSQFLLMFDTAMLFNQVILLFPFNGCSLYTDTCVHLPSREEVSDTLDPNNDGH